MKNKKIEISLPGLYYLSPLNAKVIELMEQHPEKFHDDVFIGSVYGCFPIIWNGGRPLEGQFTYSDVVRTVKFFNSKGIKVRYTFTNLFCGGDRVYDTNGNRILQITKENQTLKNEINVANPELRKYFEENYPEFGLITSTTLCLKEIEEIDEASEKGLVVPDYSINDNFEKLSMLKHPENIELVATETCTDNCPIRPKHYVSQSTCQLIENKNPILCYLVEEVSPNIVGLSRIRERKKRIRYKDIESKYLPLGINKFKLVGRKGDSIMTIEDYVEYLVKPEYKDEIRLDLLKAGGY